MSERTAKLTLRVGEKEVQFEAGVDQVEAELHRLAAELLGSAGGPAGEPPVLSLTAPGRPATAGQARSPQGASGPFLEEVVPASPGVGEATRSSRIRQPPSSRTSSRILRTTSR